MSRPRGYSIRLRPLVSFFKFKNYEESEHQLTNYGLSHLPPNFFEKHYPFAVTDGFSHSFFKIL